MDLGRGRGLQKQAKRRPRPPFPHPENNQRQLPRQRPSINASRSSRFPPMSSSSCSCSLQPGVSSHRQVLQCYMLSMPSRQQHPAMNSTPLSSLHGLAFGGGRRMKPGAPEDASSFVASAAGAERNGKGGTGHHPPPPPRCQVEGCDADLTGAKAYHCRHKVCGAHSKSPAVVVAGIQQRFCQQCSRFHQLHEFDQGKRSCRRRLACHNERRRKLPAGPSPSHSEGGSHHQSNKFSGFLVDFTRSEPPAPPQHSWRRGSPGTPPAKTVNHGETFPFDSSCALSLLSTQPWDSSSKAAHRAISSNGGGAPTAEYARAAGCKALEDDGGASSFEVRLNQVGEDDGGGSRFAGELELVLQRKRRCVGLDLSRIRSPL